MATIRKRGGSWEVQIRRKGHAPLTESFAKKCLADDWAISKEAEIREGRYHTASTVPIADLCNQYIAHVVPTHEASSHVPDKSRIGNIQRFCTARKITAASLTIDHVLLYVDERIRVVSSDAVRRELSIWSDVIESARALWHVSIPVNVVDNAKKIIRKLRKLKPGVERTRRLLPGEYELIRDATHRHFTLINQVAMFAIETAMREGEIAKVRREHIDFEKRTLFVPKSKTDWKTGKSGRIIPLSRNAIRIVQSLPVQFIDGSLFGMESASIKRAFSRLCKQAGIVGLRFHDLRREAVSRLFERGLSVEEVALISGHRTWQQLRRYTALKPEDLLAKIG